MDHLSLEGRIPLELVSLLDTLDTMVKTTKTIKLKLLCTWATLSEKNESPDMPSIKEFNRLLTDAHQKLWKTEHELLTWYKTQLVELSKEGKLTKALTSYTSDNEFRTNKKSIWGSKLITDLKAPNISKKQAVKQFISNELTPLFDYTIKKVPIDDAIQYDGKKKFTQISLTQSNNQQTITLLKNQQSPPKTFNVSNKNNHSPVEIAHISADIDRKKLCYLSRKEKEWTLFYLSPSTFDNEEPAMIETPINRAAVQGFLHIGEQSLVGVFDCEVSANNREVRILRVDSTDRTRITSTWGENLNGSSNRELVSFSYRRQHAVIMLKQSNKYSAIFFNDKSSPTTDAKAPGYFDCDLFEQSNEARYLSSNIYFKSNGLPFPYFVHIFDSFLLVNFYSNIRGAAYVSIRSQRLDYQFKISRAEWCWTESDLYDAEERLLLEYTSSDASVKKFVKF
jgi:hypothetical protein